MKSDRAHDELIKQLLNLGCISRFQKMVPWRIVELFSVLITEKQYFSCSGQGYISHSWRVQPKWWRNKKS